MRSKSVTVITVARPAFDRPDGGLYFTMSSSGPSSTNTHILGYEPVAVIDEVFNSVNDCARAATQPSPCCATFRKHRVLTLALPPVCADICDTADAMEATLLQHPDLQEHRDEIKQVCCARAQESIRIVLNLTHLLCHPHLQGVVCWQLKAQRAADKNLDKFELYALKNIFSVPENVQLVRAPAAMRSS